MGKEAAITDTLNTDSPTIDLVSKRNLSLIINEWKNLSVEELIDRAMRELGIASEWRRAVARGANHIAPYRFAALVEETKMRAKSSKPRYFIKCISRELLKR